MSNPVCAQCGQSGWAITVNGDPAAPLTLEQIHSTHAETVHFCNTLCLLRWAVEQRESVVEYWHDAWTRSEGDVNNILHAPLLERVRIHRWWAKRVDLRRA